MFSVSDQAVALCWLSLLASERLLWVYRSFVVADIRQYDDRAGWLLLAFAAHEFRSGHRGICAIKLTDARCPVRQS